MKFQCTTKLYNTVGLIVAGLLTATASAAESIQIIPSELTLTGSAAQHRLLVEINRDGKLVGEADKIKWSVENKRVVELVDGMLTAKGNGTTTVTARRANQTATAKVSVKDFEKPHSWSFRNHVLAIFAKSGCNAGSCHGALAGKGGFRLSLRGYDPERDYQTIVKQARGRRVELSDPGRSLILAKPTCALPHKGGLRFDTDSLDYRVISQWIAAGAQPPNSNDVTVTQIEMLPKQLQLSVGQKQRLVVRAYFSDGHVEDVTQWAKFTSANETVAKVNSGGEVSVIGHGVGAISVWFSSKIVISQVTSPFPFKIPSEVYDKAPKRNFIDEVVLAKLKDLRLRPSVGCSDEHFIRRVYIDAIGTLPLPQEVRDFLKDDSKDKRDQLIEGLLERPEFVDYWAYRWSDVLTVSGNRLRPNAVKAYYKWIHNEVKQNTPWDQFARKIVTATGSSMENGATNFFALHQDPENIAENVSQAFLGLSIACAKCHNHPLEKWTNTQYYAFANLFSRVRAKGWGGDYRNGDGIRTLFVVPTGELVQPLTGQPQPPTPLDGEPLDFESTDDRRIPLADWLTSPKNPYFSRAITNRIWANFFGVGIVDEVDDLRRSNPASNEALLTAASDFLVQNKFDLKALMRAIMQSKTYQRSSFPIPENHDERRFYSRYYVKRMMAEVLLDAISQVTDVPTEFTHIGFPGGDRQKTDFYPKGTRAIQLYDSAVESYFLKAFGRNQRAITCECERSDEPSMVQVLHLANGDTLSKKLLKKDNRLGKLLASKKTDEEIIDEVMLLCLSRLPTKKEQAGILAALRSVPAVDKKQRRIILEDIFWSVICTAEFLFNH
jgi:hypothetical protein